MLTGTLLQGASLIFDRLVLPFLSKHEQKIDHSLAKVKDQATTAAVSLGRKGLSKMRSQGAELLLKVRCPSRGWAFESFNGDFVQGQSVLAGPSSRSRRRRKAFEDATNTTA